MDINCVLPCLHQNNGKCALIVVPLRMSGQADFYEGCDCAYYAALKR